MKGWFGKQEGSITLEAVISLPIALALLLFLIWQIEVAIDEIALDHALHEAVHQVAAHMYAVELAEKQALKSKSPQQNTLPAFGAAINNPTGKSGKEQIADQLGGGLAREGEEWTTAIRGLLDKPLESIKQTFLLQLFRPLLLGFVDRWGDHPLLKPDRLTIVRVELPDLRHMTASSGFGLEAAYEIRPTLPFISHPITITGKAYERIWVGDKT